MFRPVGHPTIRAAQTRLQLLKASVAGSVGGLEGSRFDLSDTLLPGSPNALLAVNSVSGVLRWGLNGLCSDLLDTPSAGPPRRALSC